MEVGTSEFSVDFTRLDDFDPIVLYFSRDESFWIISSFTR